MNNINEEVWFYQVQNHTDKVFNTKAERYDKKRKT